MKRIFAMLMVAIFMVSVMIVMTAPAFALGKGHPDTNPTGKCPPGQNQDTSPGGLKKCS